MKLNTDIEDMSKSIFTIIALATIFSMSAFAHAFAESGSTQGHITKARHSGDSGGGSSGDTKSDDSKSKDKVNTNNNDDSSNTNQENKRHDSDGGGDVCNGNPRGLHATCVRHTNNNDDQQQDNSGSNTNTNTPQVNHRTVRTTTTTTTNSVVSLTVPNGLNATFFDTSTPCCWYTVNAPPCYDIKTGTVIH